MASFIRDLTLRQKLSLLLVFPVCAVLWLLGDRLVASWSQQQMANYVSSSITTSVRMNSLISALQAERGASGVYLASKGQRFGDRLKQLRVQSDEMLQIVAALNQPELLSLKQQLDSVRELRRLIDSLIISNTESAERYTNLIKSMIAVNHQLEADVPHRDMARELATLNQFIEMKERAGRDRALLGLVFSRGSFNSDLLTKYSDNFGAYNALMENFTRLLSAGRLDDWKKLVFQQSFSEVEKLQQLAFTAPLEAPLNVDDGVWFDIATKRLTDMAEFEKLLNADITERADVLKQQALTHLWGLSILTLAIAAVVFFIALVSVRNITFAVKSVDGTIRALAERNLTARCLYSSKDEFGQIALSTNAMAVELQKVISEIGEATIQVATAAEQSSAVTIETSKGVQRQQLDTELVATAMHEMAATVRDVASSTAEAVLLSEVVQSGATSGQSKLEETISLIQQLTTQVEETSGVIESVKRDSTSITSVLDVIRGIAEQTNLLALNAAIEAARAGDQGRGFAVVADEVRTLAQRTAQSTGDIQQMIEALQNNALNASNAMHLSLTLAHNGREKVAETGTILSGVLEGIHGMNDKNMQIASATEEQAAVAEDINRKIVSISDIATQTSSGAEQTAATSHQLAKLAEQLQDLVNRFQLRVS
ncbi:methyl-accepting chemotaxis protein [Rheinheimera sp.]|jgi:methyl-accepting chemotaxis protein|uniref:methyl-accepting chemotaxis protein n=1 Tax=Rheinheimera sp. TaxID=1869214 RepID=UPI00260941E0|nr:methyl-accepting chemotaxis protein [Rheinheimera sp.]MCA1931921.1 methyl-accepting chemotaxis protein [Rheinheimera sp.]